MPFITAQQKIYQTNKAVWEQFKYNLHSQINITSLDNMSVEQLKNATTRWIKAVKNPIDTAILPKTCHKFMYQLKTTPQIRNLEIQFNN